MAVRESTKVPDSGSQLLDSGSQHLDSGSSTLWIPDSNLLDSGFHTKVDSRFQTIVYISGFRIPGRLQQRVQRLS